MLLALSRAHLECRMHHVEKIVLLKNDSGMKTLFFFVGRHFIFLQRDLQHLQGGKSTQVHAWPKKASQRPCQAKEGQAGGKQPCPTGTKCLWMGTTVC